MYRGYTSEAGRIGQCKRLRDENESLRGALQAVLLSLEAMEAALAYPMRPHEQIEDLLEDAMVVTREELGE